MSNCVFKILFFSLLLSEVFLLGLLGGFEVGDTLLVGSLTLSFDVLVSVLCKRELSLKAF